MWSKLALAAVLITAVIADDIIYSNDALSSSWQDWSWNSVINYAATDVVSGTSGSSISVNSSAWSALSLKDGSANFQGYAGLQFDIEVIDLFI